MVTPQSEYRQATNQRHRICFLLTKSELIVNPDGGPPGERTDSLAMVLDGDVEWPDPAIPTIVSASLHIGHLLADPDPEGSPFGNSCNHAAGLLASPKTSAPQRCIILFS